MQKLRIPERQDGLSEREKRKTEPNMTKGDVSERRHFLACYAESELFWHELNSFRYGAELQPLIHGLSYLFTQTHTHTHKQSVGQNINRKITASNTNTHKHIHG